MTGRGKGPRERKMFLNLSDWLTPSLISPVLPIKHEMDKIRQPSRWTWFVWLEFPYAEAAQWVELRLLTIQHMHSFQMPLPLPSDSLTRASFFKNSQAHTSPAKQVAQ